VKSIYLLAFALSSFLTGVRAAEENVLSTSPDGAFELVALKTQQSDYDQYTLRQARTKKPVGTGEAGDDFINPGFGSPNILWSPDSRMLIILAKLYRDRGDFSAVFRISSDLKLVPLAVPEGSEAVRWNSDGSLVLHVKREVSYRFDPQRQIFVPTVNKQRRK
jgi:hypothetical protein